MRRSPICRLVLTAAAAVLLGAALPAGAQAGTLLHWYQAEGNGADAVLGADASDGTLLGDTIFGIGKAGQGFVVDGDDDLVNIPANDSFYPSGSATLDGWAKTTTPAPEGVSVPGQIATLYECAGFCPSFQAAAAFEIEIRNGRAFGYVRDDDSGGPAEDGEGQSISGGPLLNDGVFHQVALVRDIEAGVLALYADGIEVAEEPLNAGATGQLSNTDGQPDPFTIGGQTEGGSTTPIEEFAGTIDDVRLFSGTEYPDTTPPAVTSVLTGSAGNEGWYTSAVSVAWTISDESIIRNSTGCATTQLTASGSLSCQATSAGGSGSASVTLKLDTTAPTVTCAAPPSFALGASGRVSAIVADAGSGPAAASISAPATTTSAGAGSVVLTGRDVAGNVRSASCPYTVTAQAAVRQVAITQLATLPSPKACVSRRRFRIRLRNVKASKIVSAQIRLGAKVVRTVRGRALGLPIDLTGLPKGTFKVTITVTDAAGTKRAGARTYHTCVPKRGR